MVVWVQPLMAICVVDVESTTYAGDGRASVMDFACVVLDADDGGVLGEYTSLVRPTFAAGEWCRSALEFTGISLSDLWSAPRPDEVWAQWFPWVCRYKPVTEFLSWNVVFDRKVMAKSFPASVHLPWGPCLMRATSAALREGKRGGFKLEDAARELGLTVGMQHRALPDARLAAQIVTHFVQEGLWADVAAAEREAAAAATARAERAAERKAQKAREILDTFPV